MGVICMEKVWVGGERQLGIKNIVVKVNTHMGVICKGKVGGGGDNWDIKLFNSTNTLGVGGGGLNCFEKWSLWL